MLEQERKKGRPILFLDKLEVLQGIGESIELVLPFGQKRVGASLSAYKNNKKLNPNGRKYSYRYLGNDKYLITLLKKGS